MVMTVTTVGQIEGKMILWKICHSVAPSIRPASSSSSGTPLSAAARITIAKPVCPQTRITISRIVLSGSPVSHDWGATPNTPRMALSSPICSEPCGW